MKNGMFPARKTIIIVHVKTIATFGTSVVRAAPTMPTTTAEASVDVQRRSTMVKTPKR